MELCTLCGCTLEEAAEKGAYFKRTTPKGQDPNWVCHPSCEGSDMSTDQMVLAALEGEEENRLC